MDDLRNAFNDILSDELLAFSEGFIQNNGSVGSVVDINTTYTSPNYNWTHCVASCSPGEKFIINCEGKSTGRAYAILDSDKKILVKAEADAQLNSVVMVMPINAAYLVINDINGSQSYRGGLISSRLIQEYGIGVSSSNITMLGMTSLANVPDNVCIYFDSTITSAMNPDLPVYGEGVMILKIVAADGIKTNIARSISTNKLFLRVSSTWSEIAQAKDCMHTYGTLISSSNYQALGISSVEDLPVNANIIIHLDITDTMITGLPIYGKVLMITKFYALTNQSGYFGYYLAYCNATDEMWYRGRSSTNEWIKIKADTSTISNGINIFQKIGVIGDSISVGWAKDKNGGNSGKNFGISWPQQLARKMGMTVYNLGGYGATPMSWFDPAFRHAEDCYAKYLTTDECDLYIIGLGMNEGTLGTISDINQSDYTQNANTFYGQYARIIQMINDQHPNSIVFCLTEPTVAIHSYDQAVRDICALNFINAELVDLENDYFGLFNSAEIVAQKQPDGIHYTPLGYSMLSESMMTAMNDYVSKNSSKFKYVGVAVV